MTPLRHEDSTPVSILVVERDVELRRYLADALATAADPAPRIHEAGDVAAARSVLAEAVVDLVLAPLDAPYGGRDLCEALGIGDAGQIPVLLLGTGTPSPFANRTVRSLAATTLLEGSLSATRLGAAARRILDRNR